MNSCTFPFFLLALALSLDGLAVGCSYGLKNTKLLPGSQLVIALITALLMSLSLLIGVFFATIIPTHISNIISGFILILLGIWQLIQSWISYLKLNNLPTGLTIPHESLLADIQIKSLGIVVKILKAPHEADLDHSGDIDNKEAALLGTALGLDAFITGFGVGLTKISFLIIPVVALLQVGLLKLGLTLGQRFKTIWLNKSSFLIPGLLLIILGLLKII